MPDQPSQAQDETHPHYNPDPHAHPGLHVIAIFEAAKGLLALIAASGLEILGPVPLQRWLHELINRFQLDPHHGAIAWISSTINPGSVHLAAAIGLAYALLRFVEAWGLWQVRSWASWLGCIGAAVYLPLEINELFQHPGWLSLSVFVVNLVVVWVLARDLIKRRH